MSDAINAEQIKNGEGKKPSSFFNIIKEIFTDYYGEDRVEITEYGPEIKVVIYFPQITLRNSLHHQHIIKDLFVVTRFNSYGQYMGEYSYYRATFSTAELRRNYVHSHVSTSVASSFRLLRNKLEYCGPHYPAEHYKISLPGGNGVCLGSGPINYTMDSLRAKFTKDKLNLYKSYLATYCVEIDRNVRWESVEGGPYTRMSTLKQALDSGDTTRFRGYSLNVSTGMLTPYTTRGESDFSYNLIALGKTILKRVIDASTLTFGEFKSGYIVHRIPNLDETVLTLHTMQVLQDIGNQDLMESLLGLKTSDTPGASFQCIKSIESNSTPITRNPLLYTQEVLTTNSPFIFKGKVVPLTIYPAAVDASLMENDSNTGTEVYSNLAVDPQFINFLKALADTLHSYPQTK